MHATNVDACSQRSGESGCLPINFAARLEMKVLWSEADRDKWDRANYVPGELLVALRGTPKEINGAITRFEHVYKLKPKKVIKLSAISEVLVLFASLNPNQLVPELIGLMQRDLSITSIQPNFIYTERSAQSRDYTSLQYGPKLMRADRVSRHVTGKGIRIALIDTSVGENQDLNGIVIETANFTYDKECSCR